MSASIYNWRQKGWPRFTYNRAHLSDELSAFADAFRKVKAALRSKQDPELIVRTLTDEAVVTSRIEGVTYRLAVDLSEPIEPLDEPLNARLMRLVQNHPGTQLPYLLSVVRESRATVKRVLSALIAEGKIEHRGSKKTGGYYIKQ